MFLTLLALMCLYLILYNDGNNLHYYICMHKCVADHNEILIKLFSLSYKELT